MKLKTRNALAGYLLALPFLIGFAGFYLIPFLWSIRFTFTSGSGGTAFVGLRNYLDIFGSAAFRLAGFHSPRSSPKPMHCWKSVNSSQRKVNSRGCCSR